VSETESISRYHEKIIAFAKAQFERYNVTKQEQPEEEKKESPKPIIKK